MTIGAPPEGRVEVEGIMALDDYVRFHYFHTLRRSWPLALLSIVAVLAMIVWSLYVAVTDNDQGWPSIQNAPPFFGLLLFWSWLFCGAPWLAARKQTKSGQFGNSFVLTLDAAGIAHRDPDVSWSLSWDAVIRVCETKSLFVFYHHDRVGAIVPKRLLSNDNLRKLNALIINNVSLEKIQPLYFPARWC